MLAGTPAPYVEDKTAIEVPNARPFALGDATATDLPRSSSLTRTGVVMGTPRYMAPELHDGARFASPSSDVYAFGLVACVALAGAHPNDRPDVAAELRRLAPDLADLVIACLAEDPHERPTLEALVAALDDDRRFTAA
jgi:serine/threonine protein kinase